MGILSAMVAACRTVLRVYFAVCSKIIRVAWRTALSLLSPYLTSTKYQKALAKWPSGALADRSYALAPLAKKPADMPPVQRLMRDGPAQPPIEHFTSGLGLNLIAYSWQPTRGKPKAVVLFLHGLDGCAEADLSTRLTLEQGRGYVGSWAESLNDAGYLIYSFDYNGMGFSESVGDSDVRSLCYDYGDYVDEALAFRRLLGTRHPDLPFVLLAGSMGACVGLHVAERAPELFSCCVFSAPAVSFERLKALPKNQVVLPVLSVVSQVAPWLPVGDKATSHDEEMIAEECRMGLPYFNRGKMRARYCEHGLLWGEAAAANANKLTMPLLLLHDSNDPMTDFDGSVLLMERAASTDKTLLSDFGGGQPSHNIFFSDVHSFGRKYIGQIIEWADARL